MQRREMLKKVATGAAAAGALAAPAMVRAQATLNWRCASSFPKSLDTIFGSAEHATRRIGELSGGKFNIRLFAGGEIVPPLQVADAVMNGTIECGHTASYYYIGKDPVWTFGTTIPFGMNFRQYNAWWIHGGGNELMNNEWYHKHGIHALLSGNTGGQMGGWFNKEIKSVEDLKGLKFRIAGLPGKAFAKLGAVPSMIPGGEVYQALERGTIDAVEWVGPYDDEKFGLQKVAKFYYYPGWWEPSAALMLFVNLKAWEGLSKEYKAAFEASAYEANQAMMAKYDFENPPALKRLIAGGAQLKSFPKAVMDACYKAMQEVYGEIAGTNPMFKKVLDHQTAYQTDAVQWSRLNEGAYDSYMGTIRR